MAFLIIFAVGLFFAILTFVIGELFDFGGDGAAEAGDAGATPSPFSSRIVFVFITAFGGFGYIGDAADWPVWASVALALGGGLAVAAGTFFLIVVPLGRQQGTTEVHDADFIAMEGEVTSEIPEGGIGRVTVIAGASGARVGRAARSVSGERLPFGTLVRVIHAGQGLVTVAPLAADGSAPGAPAAEPTEEK